MTPSKVDRATVTTHAFERCGAGTKTSDSACYIVRDHGGKRELCHYTAGPVEFGIFCQKPASAHLEQSR